MEGTDGDTGLWRPQKEISLEELVYEFKSQFEIKWERKNISSQQNNIFTIKKQHHHNTTTTKAGRASFFKWANPGLFLFIFFILKHNLFTEKNIGSSGVQTRIVGVEGEPLTTWPPPRPWSSKLLISKNETFTAALLLLLLQLRL